MIGFRAHEQYASELPSNSLIYSCVGLIIYVSILQDSIVGLRTSPLIQVSNFLINTSYYCTIGMVLVCLDLQQSSAMRSGILTRRIKTIERRSYILFCPSLFWPKLSSGNTVYVTFLVNYLRLLLIIL